MRQVTVLTSTYSSDVFGICSALYELGGMVVMHDASGCNSTYTTHDEPRWYDMDSMIYVSAISEMEAILGDDEKWITDLTETALELRPVFIALVLAPIPYMIGTDVEAIAREVEHRTGIRCFAFAANGMHDYTAGVSSAMEQLVSAYAASGETVIGGTRIGDGGNECGEDATPTVNFLGVTPLDFTVDGSVESMRKWARDHGLRDGVCLAMGCTVGDIERLPRAQVNLVVSSGGLAAAELLSERYNIPYVVGVPFGERFADSLADTVRKSFVSGESITSLSSPPGLLEKEYAVIGEPVASVSLAEAIGMETGVRVKVLCPLECGSKILRPGDVKTPEEDDLIREIKSVDGVIADPLYRTLCGEKEFYPLPHTAFSGRIYEKNTPNLFGSWKGIKC